MGIYFLESGAVQRASKVVYDRAGASIAEVKRGDINWDVALAGADGRPMLSPHIAETTQVPQAYLSKVLQTGDTLTYLCTRCGGAQKDVIVVFR